MLSISKQAHRIIDIYSMGTSTGFSVIFCGADDFWDRLQATGFRRRNTCLLNELTKHPHVDRVYNVHLVSNRLEWLRLFLPSLLRAGKSKVFDIYLPVLIPGQGRFGFIKKMNTLLAGTLVKLLTYEPSTSPVFFAYWPKGLELALRMSGDEPIVFDADHNIVDDENFSSEEQGRIRSLLYHAAGRNVLGIAAARTMLDCFESYGIPHARLRNGVDPARFEGELPVPVELSAIPRPIIGYVGTLSRWMDLNMLATLAVTRPRWSFAVIGSLYKNSLPDSLSGINNLYFLGDKSAAEAPAYFRAFDAGLSLYRNDCPAWLDPDSMKIFEYLAAGTPLVCSGFHKYLNEDFADLLRIGSDAEEVICEIETVLALGSDELGVWREKAKCFVQQNTWEVRARELVELFEDVHSFGNKLTA